MKKAYINSPDSQTAASDYMITIIYVDGEVFKKKITQYSYSNVFEVIKDMHEGENDKMVKSIKIEYIR